MLEPATVQAFQDEVESLLKFTGAEKVNVSDLFIMVMGMTGSGKSTFISRCTGADAVIGHGLRSCTSILSAYSFLHGSRRIYLIDSPGWDDTERSDTDTLKEIASYLTTSYAKGIRISAILYLHRISDIRMGGTAKRNIDMFKALCGYENYTHVTIVTTMWPNHEGNEMDKARMREKELIQTYWSNPLDNGAKMVRHTHDSQKSALEIIDELLESLPSLHEGIVLALQSEIVDKELSLEETSAGRALNKDINMLRESLQQELNRLSWEVAAAQKSKDKEVERNLGIVRKDFQAKLDEAEKRGNNMKVTMQEVLKEEHDKVLKKVQDTEERARLELAAKTQELDALQDSVRYIIEDREKAKRKLKEEAAKRRTAEEKSRAAQKILADKRKTAVIAEMEHKREFENLKQSVHKMKDERDEVQQRATKEEAQRREVEDEVRNREKIRHAKAREKEEDLEREEMENMVEEARRELQEMKKCNATLQATTKKVHAGFDEDEIDNLAAAVASGATSAAIAALPLLMCEVM